MVPYVTAHVLTLLAQLDTLKGAHRAGETPTFGQVEALFDQAAVVRAALASPDPSRAAAWPSAANPIEAAARRLVAALVAELGSSRPAVGDSPAAETVR